MPRKKKQPTTNKNKVVSKVRTNNNEGSIFKRSSDGLWVGSITVGYDDKGRQVWTRSQNGKINEGGRNNTPRPWDKETGLYNNPLKRKKKGRK